MSVKKYMDEFRSKYKQPGVNRVTVGFSGIDPDEKSLNETQKEEATELIESHYEDKIGELKGIDCGEIV